MSTDATLVSGDDRQADGVPGPDRMWRVGHVDLIPPGEGRTFRVEGEEVAVFRTRDGRLFALQAACSHAGGPLADGLIGDGRVLCPLHGFAFALESGEPIRHECPALRSYRVMATAAGEILVGMR